MKSAAVLFLVGWAAWAMPALGSESQTDAQGGRALPGDSLGVYFAEETIVTQDRVQVPRYSGIAAKIPVPLHQTPASVAVVDAGRIKRQQAAVLGEALRNVAGVNPQTGFGVFDFFTVRGFDSLESGLLLSDGVAEPEVSFYPLYNVERVEVLKGPGAFLYGGNPLAGTVNLARKQPFVGRQARVGLAYGSFARARANADLNWAAADGGLALRFNGLFSDAGNYRDDKDSRVWAFNPALTWRPDERTEFKFNFEYVDSEYRSDAGLPLVVDFINGGPPSLAAVSRKQSYQSPHDLSDQATYRLRLEASRQVTPALLVRGRAYYTDFNWVSRGTLFNGVFPTEQGELVVSRTLTLLDDTQRLLGVQLETQAQFSTAGLEHQLLAGIEANRFTDVFTQDIVAPDPRIPNNVALPPIALFDPVESAPALAGLSVLPFSAADARTVVLAPYLVDRVRVGRRLSVWAGGRFDLVDYSDPTPYTDATGAERDQTQRDYKSFNPLAGLVVQAHPDLSLYASAGTAFAPPSAQIAGERRAENSAQIEAGAKARWWDGRLSGAAAVYRLKRDNIAIPDAQGLTRQNGDQQSTGFELELSGQPTPAWLVFAGYAFVDAELSRFAEVDQNTGQVLDRSGNQAAFAPRHTFNLWIDRRLPAGFEAGAGGRYVGEQSIAADNAYSLDAYMTVDATLAYSYGPWRWRLNAKNLTDTQYETRGFGAASVIPAEPLSLSMALEWSPAEGL
jgi:TonB-dependent siderophore receptor